MTWLSWEYMHSKLVEVSFNGFADGEVTEEESESYMDEIGLYDLAEMQEEYEEVIGFGDDNGRLNV